VAASQEKTLIARCRSTPGVRFVHFEPDRGAGSICIFKIPNSEGASEQAQIASEQTVSWDPGTDAKTTYYRKSDAQSPLLTEIEELVTSFTDRCLKKEKAGDLADAGRCWKSGAKALEDLTENGEGLLPQQYKGKLAQLKTAWLQRSDQLKPHLVVAKQKAEQRSESDTIVPTSSRDNGPDPNRLVETAACSSTRLGDKRKCVGSPAGIGANTYAFGLRSNCSKGVIAAIKVHNRNGRCIRKVVVLLPDGNQSENILSYREPGVIDAISYRDAETYDCYARRHDLISCDGKIDYGASASLKKQAGLSQGRIKQLLDGRKRLPATEKNPSLLRRISGGIKSLFDSE
jgi:hypothetical protein